MKSARGGYQEPRLAVNGVSRKCRSENGSSGNPARLFATKRQAQRSNDARVFMRDLSCSHLPRKRVQQVWHSGTVASTVACAVSRFQIRSDRKTTPSAGVLTAALAVVPSARGQGLEAQDAKSSPMRTAEMQLARVAMLEAENARLRALVAELRSAKSKARLVHDHGQTHQERRQES